MGQPSSVLKGSSTVRNCPPPTAPSNKAGWRSPTQGLYLQAPVSADPSLCKNFTGFRRLLWPHNNLEFAQITHFFYITFSKLLWNHPVWLSGACGHDGRTRKAATIRRGTRWHCDQAEMQSERVPRGDARPAAYGWLHLLRPQRLRSPDNRAMRHAAAANNVSDHLVEVRP